MIAMAAVASPRFTAAKKSDTTAATVAGAQAAGPAVVRGGVAGAVEPAAATSAPTAPITNRRSMVPIGP
jgi:hypothetical protein